ncbi:MAG: beta strand repeat-containing protein, partial [Acetobacteraceae bacterium]
MKSSLASATSVFALLVFETGRVVAPVLTVGAAAGALLEPSAAFANTISVSPSNTIDIYDLVGSALVGSATITVTGSDTGGTSSTLQNSNTISSGESAAGFAGSGIATTTVPGGQSRTATATYTFDRATTGTATAKVSFKMNGATTQSVTLVGQGVAPVADLTGGTVTNILVGQSASVAVTVSNTGNGNLAMLSNSGVTASLSNLNGTIGSASSGLFTGGGSSISIGDTSSTTVNYIFTPTQTGTATATVLGAFTNGTTNKNAAGTLTATLTGNGVAPVADVSVSNTPITSAGGAVAGTGNVGNVLVGESVAVTVTVNNTGNGNLSGLGTVSNLRGAAGAAGNSVFVGSGTSFSLQDSTTPGATTSTTASYVFTPTGRGAVNTTAVTAFDNGTGAGGQNLAGSVTTTLSGTGVAPVLNVSSTASAGYVLVSQSAAASVTVNNTGDGNLSGRGTISNLRGTMGTAASSGFSGGGGSVSLTDSTSTTVNYVFTPSARGAASAVVTSTFVNGNATNTASAPSTTLTGTGVAPVNQVSSTGTTYVRMGTSGSTSVTVKNVGDGNLSGAGAISNLNGSVGTTLGTGFTAAGGNPTSVSLADAATSTLGFTYAPGTSRAVNSSTAVFSFGNGKSDGTNAAQSVTATVSAQGVGPTLQSKLGTTINTPTAVPNGATVTTGPTIDFGTVGWYTTTVLLNLANITADLNGGNDALTDLTINSFAIAGADASKFSATLTPGTVIHKGSSIYLPISVLDTSNGILNGTLTLFTDQSVALGGVGDTFTYQLLATVVPEPASVVAFCSGLVGLAAVRRRRKRRD